MTEYERPPIKRWCYCGEAHEHKDGQVRPRAKPPPRDRRVHPHVHSRQRLRHDRSARRVVVVSEQDDLREAEELIAALGLVGAVRWLMYQEDPPLDYERPWDEK